MKEFCTCGNWLLLLLHRSRRSYFRGILQTKLYSATPYSLAALIESAGIQATRTNLSNDITHIAVVVVVVVASHTHTHTQASPCCFVSDRYTRDLQAAKSLLVLLSSKQTNTTRRGGTHWLVPSSKFSVITDWHHFFFPAPFFLLFRGAKPVLLFFPQIWAKEIKKNPHRVFLL